MRCAVAPRIDGAEVSLRPIELADIDAWYAYLSLPGAVEHTSWNLQSVDDLRPLVEWYNADDSSSAIRFAIEGADRRLIGTIGFHTISPAHRTAEIAYDIDPEFRHRGIATACCRATVAWGFSARGYVRIQATVLPANGASIRVLERCGFALEGRLRNYRIVRGEPREFLLYATTAAPPATPRPN